MMPKSNQKIPTGWPWMLPLAFLPVVVNLKSSAFLDTTTPIKWACFTLLGVMLSLRIFTPNQDRTAQPSGGGISLPASLFALFFIGLAIGVTYAVNLGEGLNRLALWAAGGACFIASVCAARSVQNYSRYLQWALTLSALILCTQFLYALKVDFPDPSYDQYREFSLIGHFNMTADVLMVLMPLLAWTTITAVARITRVMAALCLIGSCVMLMASGSLGGMIGITAGAVFTGVLWIIQWLRQRKKGTTGQTFRFSLYALAGILAISVVIGLAFQKLPEDMRKRVFERGEWWGAPKSIDAKSRDSLPPLAPLWMALTPALGSRAPMWAATAGMIAEHPWRGFGTGSYEYEYRNFGKRFDVFKDPEILGINAKTNPHNIFLQLASENGLPMALLFSSLYVWLTFRVMQQAWKNPTALWLCGLWALTAAGLESQVNHTFLYPASLLICATVFGFFYGRLPIPQNRYAKNLVTGLKKPVFAYLALGLSFLLATVPLRWVASEYYASQAYFLAEKHPKTHLRDVKYGWEAAIDWFPYNAFALYGLARYCYGQHNFPCAETHLHKVLQLSPYHTPALNVLAYIQTQTNRLDQAEFNLKKALLIDPESTTVKENLDAVIKLKKRDAPETNTSLEKTP